MSAFFQFFENVKKSNFFQSSKKNWTGATLMLCCCWLDAWVCEPLFSRRKFREIGSRFFYNSPFSSPSSCKTAWEEGQQVLKIINVFDQEIGFLKKYSGGTVLGLVPNLVEKRLKWSKCGEKWKYSTVGKSGNLVIRPSLKSTRRVEKSLLHKLQKTPKQYFCDFHYIFFKAIFKKI